MIETELVAPKTITKPFAHFNSYGDEEVQAAVEVIKSGVLSKFLGCWNEDFFGGPKVLQFENAWAEHFKVKHAISVNSATSGLIAALGALDIGPGDEVIVSPWTMSASATAILVWNAIPVFADIEDRTFNLDPQSVAKKISSRTKAIVLPDIFGHGANFNDLIALAKKHNLKIIEDAAQAPGALYQGKYVGTIADIGVFSLNYHKHIHTGEGGVCVTNDPDLAERMQLIRNHAEAVVANKSVKNFNNLIGFNFRLGEIEAAMGMEQLKKLPGIIERKCRLAHQLIDALQGLPGLRLPIIEENCTHVFYVMPFILDRKLISLPRNVVVQALKDEGLDGLAEGYANIHLLPIYQKKIAYGHDHYPWVGQAEQISYEKGICPVAEKLHTEDFFSFLICLFELNDSDIKLIAKAFYKAWEKLGLL